MIAVDTNLLVYAHRRDARLHEAAWNAVRSLAEGTALWAIPWPCIHEFLAVVTHPGIYDPPSTSMQASEQVDAWLESPRLVMIGETDKYWLDLRSVLGTSQVRGPRVQDARIAALCSLHGVRELWTADRDFSSFSGINVRNPLVK